MLVGSHFAHVCCGVCSQVSLPHGSSRMDANRGPSGLDPDHPWSPSSFSAVQGDSEAHSVSRFEAGAQAVSSKDGPSEVEDHETRGCIDGFGAGTVGSPCEFGRSSQDGGPRFLRHHQPPSGGISCRGECEDCSAREFIGSSRSRMRWRRSVHEQSSQRMNYCEHVAKRLEKAQEVVCEALKVQSQREEELAEGKRRLEGLQSEAAATSSSCPATHSFRNRRVDASPKSCGPVGGRSEGKSPIGLGEDFSGDQFETTNRSSYAGSCSFEGPHASTSIWVRCQSPSQDLRYCPM